MSSKQRRRRAARTAGAAKAAEAAQTAGPRTARPARLTPIEYQQRDLSGAGASQLSPERALRARDLNRPTAEELADAEANVVIVRRHWQPGA